MRCTCVEETGDICPRCESAAEERRYGNVYDGLAADYEAERYQRWLDGMWGDA